MKTILKTGTVLLLLVGLAAALQAKGFEGELRYELRTPKGKQPTEMTYWVKGDKIRYEWAGKSKKEGAAGIIDGKKRVMVMLLPEQKSYMEWSLDKMKESAEQMQPKEKKKPEFHKTGRKETILGYACEEWLMEHEHGTSEIWATKELGRFMGFGSRGGKDGSSLWETEASAKGLFPLKMVHKDLNGKETSTMTATKAEQKSVPDASFAVPAGYRKMETPDLGAMKQSMKQGAKDGAKQEMKKNMKDLLMKSVKPY